MSTSPLVSVVLPAHNASETILRALDSVAAQTYRNLEIIVIDDAGTDRTAEVVAGWKKLPVRFERLDKQSGAAAARNRGLELASGEFAAFLDADDEWLPEKTALQVAMFQSYPGVSFVSSESWQINAQGQICGLVNADRARATGPDGWKTLLRHPCVATPSVMVRKSQALALGGFDTRLAIAEDQDFWIRLSLAGPVAHVPVALVRVHEQPHSLSRRQYRRTAAITLPVVLGHLRANGHRLSRREARLIRATRFAALGRNAYLGGAPLLGAWLLLRATALGYQPLANLSYLLFSSAPARWAKRRLLGRSALAPQS
jgi:glycosyltransferase involved in cell wall biosynthesis